jgi:hypothetical protein
MRTPLTAIQMCAELLATRDDPRQRARYAAVIAEQARSMTWSLENLVALADDLDEPQADLHSVDLVRVASACAADLETFAEARKVTIETPPPPARLEAPGREWALSQAMRACMQVLLALTREGGALRVGAQERDGRAEVALVIAGPAGEGSAEDRPDGMDALDLPWNRLSLLTAGKLVAQHGGQLCELRGPGGMGLRMVLPFVRSDS